MSATSNQYDLRYIEEATPGVTPSNPALKYVRITQASLTASNTFTESEELSPLGVPTDVALTDRSVSGTVDIEASYASHDDFLSAALKSNWAVTDFSGSATTTTLATNNLTATGAFANVVVGQLIDLKGMTTAANNRTYRVVAKQDNSTITVSPIPASAETTVDANITSDVLRSGQVNKTFTLVERFKDSDDHATRTYRGEAVSTYSMSLATGSIVTGQIGFMGRSSEWGTDPAISGETSVDAPLTPVFDSVNNIDNVWLGSVNLCEAGLLQSLDFNIDNQHREQKAVCKLGAANVVAGTQRITVSGTQYFFDKTEAERAEAVTDFAFSFRIVDNDGNGYDILLPRCKYSQYDVAPGGKDSDVTATFELLSLADPDTGAVAVVSRIRTSPGPDGTT